MKKTLGHVLINKLASNTVTFKFLKITMYLIIIYI